MAKKKYKRLTQREKDERAALRKRLREEGLLPPRKPSLNRKGLGRFCPLTLSFIFWSTLAT